MKSSKMAYRKLSNTVREQIKASLRKVNSTIMPISRMPPQTVLDEDELRIAEAREFGQREHNIFQMWQRLDKVYGRIPESGIVTYVNQQHRGK